MSRSAAAICLWAGSSTSSQRPNRPKITTLSNRTLRTESHIDGNAVTVLGLKGLLTTMARCCNPTPGDQIVGYITRGRGATIHRQDCPNMLRTNDRERMVKVSWGEPQTTYPVASSDQSL